MYGAWRKLKIVLGERCNNWRGKLERTRGGLTIAEWRNKLLRMIEFLGFLPQAAFPNTFASLRCAH
jgi:hypothetical protein